MNKALRFSERRLYPEPQDNPRTIPVVAGTEGTIYIELFNGEEPSEELSKQLNGELEEFAAMVDNINLS